MSDFWHVHSPVGELAHELPVVHIIFASVELREGPRLPTNIVEVDREDIHIDMAVSVRFVPTEKADMAIPVFRPRD